MNKRNKNDFLDPLRINNYNKFLATLDSGNKKGYKGITNTNTNSEEKEKEKEKEKQKEKDNIKNEIDKIIERIGDNFTFYNIASPYFNGQSPSDLISLYIGTNDPNKYSNQIMMNNINLRMPTILTELNERSKPKPVKEFIPVQNTSKPEIKETITIETTINSISDLLKLIDTYKADPSIQYNIDIAALHKIKEPLQELNNMIGMANLKNNIVDQIIYFIQDLHKNKNAAGEFLHTVIYGPPGTGKTEVAKIMGKIYGKIGILSKGTFKKVVRSDLVAGYLGQTAIKTKDVINDAVGGVLFIDEAYSLGNNEKKDSFSKECIDTLCEALSDHRDNLMVIIAGYEKELKECFFNYNQGLDSRFTWRFKTDEYNHDDLCNIFLKKVADIGWEVDCSKINANWFKKNKEYFRYYGRDIETLLSKTKIAHSRRVFCCAGAEKKRITIDDLEKGLEIYLKNDEIKSKKEEEEFKKYLSNSLYT
jgi:SpoVK/Ycf46/Vps4 family AAA+-type ATPase